MVGGASAMDQDRAVGLPRPRRPGTALCSWARHFTLIYSASLHLGVNMGTGELLMNGRETLQWTSIASYKGRSNGTKSLFMLLNDPY